jgi:hypothetical protein
MSVPKTEIIKRFEKQMNLLFGCSFWNSTANYKKNRGGNGPCDGIETSIEVKWSNDTEKFG